MSQFQTFLSHFNIGVLGYYLLQAAVALLCIVSHEVSHGYAAYLLGDDTAKRSGRLSMNPLRHIDPLGLLLMIFAGFGWAKPVPVNMNRFKNPKRDMALTALAGPAANFLMAIAAMGITSLLYHFAVLPTELLYQLVNGLFAVLIRIAMLSIGLGMFNLIPIPPLDGSKVLFALLPESGYRTILRYERYVMLALFALVFFGYLDGPLALMRDAGLRVVCFLTGFPYAAFG